MAFKKTNRKAQAAIEFLMTYGWMLLVVLIVGALIFSFVDFGGLLPSQLDLNNNLQGDGTQIVASSARGDVQFAFTYIGARASTINLSSLNISSDNGFSCDATSSPTTPITLQNIDSGASVTAATLAAAEAESLSVISGQLVLATIPCPTGTLISGDVLEGDVEIELTSSRTNLVSTSTGRIRATVE